MNTIQFLGAIELGLIYSLVAMGVYLSFRTLQFPDLTVDGSFPLGAAVCATLIVHGVNPYMATLAALLSGVAAGVITAALSTRLKMLNLLAGILVMTALYSVNLRIMDKPNISLLGEATIFTGTEQVPGYVPLLVIILIMTLLVWRFLSSRLGLALRSTGSNARMARAQGINDKTMIKLGLGLSNGLVALAGALFAQMHGFADVTMGVGTIIIGLASVIIGESFLPIRTVFQALVACIAGTLLYRLAIAMAFNVNSLGLKASDLNLITALLVVAVMLIPSIKSKIRS